MIPILLWAGLALGSCKETIVQAGFEDMLNMTIYDYIVENDSLYSSFLSILEKAKLDKTLSAYNPNGIDYTLFLPGNEAIEEYIRENDQYGSLNDLLNDAKFVSAFARYHVINMGILTNDFPFGAFSEATLSNDYLTVTFVIEEDTSYYKINNQSPVIKPNIELSNGYIHIIQKALNPVTYTTYDWLEQHGDFSIFKAATDLTGIRDTLDINKKNDPDQTRPFTLLVEPDSIYRKQGIYSVSDLSARISPGNSDYRSRSNPLFNYVAYHIVEEERFLDDFEGVATNYATYSDIPLHISGLSIDLMINKGKEKFDTLIVNKDTTIIDYIGFNYDASNVITQSGAIHFIDRVMKQYPPSRAIANYEFFEEPLFYEYREKKEPGNYLVENPASLYSITWTGPDLIFVMLEEETTIAWNDDYLQLTGDFSIRYTLPKIVQGRYDVFLGADRFSQLNAVVEVTIDGKKVGGLIDLTSGGTAASPIQRIKLGTVDFIKYDKHVIEVKSLIPGRFIWDYLRFEPI